MKECFDSEKYIKLQSKIIRDRLKEFDGKLYMEFGGKLFDDLHASRVLPGFDPNVQIKLLDNFKDECEIVFVISARDIEKNKIRADFGITYDVEVLRLIEKFRERGLVVSGIVITLFDGQESALKFKEKLESLGETVYIHYFTKGYPTDIETIVSEKGYGKNPYVKTTRPLVVISAPGPGSGKLATCLSQLYHEYKMGKKAGYAKFEKFPVWNLPLKHPINIAYEAATADLKDVNVIDSYHFEAYNEIASSYNRDMEIFPVVRNIIKKITGKIIYKSPTDMGINTIASCIYDEEVAKEAAKQEIIRRYLRAKVDYKKGSAKKDTAERIKMLMDELNLKVYDRKCVLPAIESFEKTNLPSVAIEVENEVVVGVKTENYSAPASAILNVLKTLGKTKEDLIDSKILGDILDLKKNILHSSTPLTLKETLVALSFSANLSETSKKAYNNLTKLRNCNAHSSHILSSNNEETLRKIGINLTCCDNFLVENLFED